MNRTHLCTATGLICSIFSLAQAPVITHVDKYIEGNAKRITLAGSNFGSVASDITVYFGAQKGTVVTVANQLVEVTSPPGATLEQISITNTSARLTAYSQNQFHLAFGGEHPFSNTSLAGQQNFDGETGLFDFCLCDLDGDGKTDVASTSKTNLISLFRNTSPAPNDIQFTKTTQSVGAQSLHVKCGDLNGDGKKDLVVSEADPGDRVFVLTNNSTAGTFSFTQQTLTFTGKLPKQIEIMDLDLDGKPEVIITDQRNTNKDFLILRNTSAGAAISFAPVVSIAIPASTNTASSDGLAVHDLDFDNRPEIIVTQFLTANGNVFIFKNESSQGTLRFNTTTTLTLTGATSGLRVGDLTGDGKPEIVATQLFSSGIVVFQGQSTETEIKFGDPTSFTTDVQPWGLDFGDLDGDGKLDIVVASISTSKLLSVLVNTSTTTTLSFAAKQSITSGFVNRHVRIGDLSGDGKPDVAFASVDDATVGPASKISTMRNTACIIPKITPTGPVAICTGFPIPLEATASAGATYQWKKNGTDIAGATNDAYTPTAPGDLGTAAYTVAITSDGCSRTSAATNANLISVSALPAPTMSSNSPVCKDATLTAGAVSAGADGYEWTGPAGFTASGTSITRSQFQAEFAGRYEVNVMASGCIAQKGFVVVEMITLPDFKVGFTGNDLICTGNNKVLTVDPNDANFTYQWFEKDAGAIAGATNTTHTINSSGEYYFEAQSIPYPACPAAPSVHSVFRVVALPVVAFSSPASTCRDMVVTFTNESVLEGDAGANFLWDFGDGTPASDAVSPTHTYLNTGNFNVKLVAAYRGNTCPAELIKPISVAALPTATIITTGGVFQLCPGATLKLEVSAPFTSYLWSTNETTPTIDVTTGGNYSVRLTNSIGCFIQPSQAVTLLTPPAVTASADPPVINIGQSTQLAATAGLSSYDWSPGRTLSDSTIVNPVARPTEPTVYKVIAAGSNGCTGEAEVSVEVTFDDIVNLLAPGNFISPNGDGFNDTWEVGLIDNFPQCGVKIFNEKGARVFEATPYDNDWDAMLNGKPLPNGVYFYTLQCGDESESRSGSITVIR